MSTPQSLIDMRKAHREVTGEKWCYLCTRWKKIATEFTKGLRCCDSCQAKKRKPQHGSR